MSDGKFNLSALAVRERSITLAGRYRAGDAGSGC